MGAGIVIITCITNLALGLFVLVRDPKANSARAFAAMTLLICVWVASSYVTELPSSNIEINEITNRLAFIGGYGTVLAGLIFTYNFPVVRKIKTIEKISLLIISGVIIMLSATSLISGNVEVDTGGKLQFSIGPLLFVYIAGFVGLLILISRNLLFLPARIDKARKMHAKLVLAAFCFSSIAGLTFNLILPLMSESWHTTQFGPLATVILAATIVYAIAKHGLFDVRLAVIRTVVYMLSLLTLAGIYYVLALTISELLLNDVALLQPFNVVLALLLAFIFQPIKRFFDRLTKKLFYKDSYNSDDFFASLSRILTSVGDLRNLLERSAYEISTTLKSEQAFFFIQTSVDDGHYVCAGTPRHKQLPVEDARSLINARELAKEVVVADLLEDEDPVRRMMVSHQIALILPLVQKDSVLGYLCLGDHRTSGYTKRDIRVLSTIADELVIAIQNALSMHALKELNATLQQRIDEATSELRASNSQLQRLDEAKDEFISMASHQLRTPLTSVKGYISMILDGDVGKVADRQRHLLREAFMSSERMVRLINDFLNVSRLQTGKFIIDKRPADLSKIVSQELESLEISAASRNLKFAYKFTPKKFPILNIDQDKLRQVIMNFTDNAIFYSSEHTTIKINLSIDEKEALFTVKDTGIGVPKDEQARLFNKFFRASNARKQRPDGTGVGLFLAKKVIVAHGGEVVFESKENKGSVFGFRLSLDKVRLADDTDKLKDKPAKKDNDS